MQIYLSNPSYANAVESLLESFSVFHPVLNKEIHPFVLLNRAEMESGVDGVLGRIAQNGGLKHAELYSEWYIDYPVDDQTKPRWPDLMGFTLHRYQGVYTGSLSCHAVGGHGGIGDVQDIPLIIRGPGIKRGAFSEAVYPADIAPTIYQLLGWVTPKSVDGRVLNEILE